MSTPLVVDSMVPDTLGNRTLRSKCACGSVEVEISSVSPIAQTAASCHCRKCRKYHISAFTNYLVVDESQISFTKGSIHGDLESIMNNVGSIGIYKDSCDEVGEVERLFCRRCFGKILTRLPSLSTTPEADSDRVKDAEDKLIYVNMGALDDDTISGEFSEAWKSKTVPWQVHQACAWARATPSRGLSRGSMPREHHTMITGGCSCGAYQYEFPVQYESTILELQHCYCNLCRRLSGSPFSTWVPIGRDELEWKYSAVKTSEASDRPSMSPPMIRTTPFGRRHVCPKCAGVLTIVYDSQPDLVWPAAGGFDDANVPTELEKLLGRVVHICCRWKQSWYDIPMDDMERLDNAC